MSRKKQFTSRQIKDAARRYVAGGTLAGLASKLRCSRQTLANSLVELGIAIRPLGWNLKNRRLIFTLGQCKSIAARYSLGVTAATLASENKCCLFSIYKAIRRAGSKARPIGNHRVHVFDESTFDRLDDERVQYWAGMIAADGCVQTTAAGRPHYCLSIALAGSDGDHLEELRSLLKTDAPLRIKTYKARNTCQPATVLNVYSKRIVEDLGRLGIVPRKSLTGEWRLLTDKPAFWRGVICGDGCLHIDSRGRYYLRLVGSEKSMHQFINFAKAHTATRVNVGKRVTPYHRRDGSVAYSTFYAVDIGGRSAVELTHILFANATVALPRKKAIADKIIRRYYHSS